MIRRLLTWIIDFHARNVLEYAEHLRRMDRIKQDYDTRLWLLKHGKDASNTSKEGE